MSKKTKIFALWFILFMINILFSVPMFPTEAVIGSFTLQDGFEGHFENKIYSQYENKTISEFFTTEKKDTLNFVEGDNEYIYPYPTQNPTVDNETMYQNSIDWGTYQRLKITVGNTTDDKLNLNTFHWNVLEFRMRTNINSSISQANISYTCDANIGLIYLSNITFVNDNQFHTYTVFLNWDESLVWQLTIFLVDFNDIPFTADLDYLHIYRTNISDYFINYNNNAVDFTLGIGEYCSSSDLHFSYSEQMLNTYRVNYGSNYLLFNVTTPNLDFEYYNHMYLKLYWSSNDSTSTLLIRPTNQAFSYFISASKIVGTRDMWLDIDFELTQNLDSGSSITILEFNTPLATSNITIDIDSIMFYHKNLEDNKSFYGQETTITRAYVGLKSFYHEYGKQIYYKGFDLFLNNSIRIDVNSIYLFPQKIEFRVLSNASFTLYLVIGTTKYTLDSKSSSFEWQYIRERVSRQDYILNSTDVDCYFLIEFLDNTPTLVYLDNLKIIYTEFLSDYATQVYIPTGKNLTDFDYIHTDNSFMFDRNDTSLNPSDDSINTDNEGIIYLSNSNDLFTRRMYNDYRITGTRETVLEFRLLEKVTIEQIANFTIDKDYTIVQTLVIYPQQYGINHSMYALYYVKFYVENDLIIDHVERLFNDTMTLGYDLIFYKYDYGFSTAIVQETYNVISIGANFENYDTGNATSMQTFFLEINTNNQQTSLNVGNVQTKIWFDRHSSHECSPKVYVAIHRSISHSTIPGIPAWQWKKPPKWLGILLGLLAIYLLIVQVMGFFTHLSETITDILNGVNTWTDGLEGWKGFKDGWDTFTTDFSSNLDNAFSSNLDDILNNIEDNIFNNPIIVDFEDIYTDFENKDWSGLQNSFANVFPDVDESLLKSTEFFFGGFFQGIFGISFTALFDDANKVIFNIAVWITLLIIMYLIYIMKRIMARDWDRLGLEMSRVYHIVKMLIDAVIFIFHWIFEIIHAILDVAIPFT